MMYQVFYLGLSVYGPDVEHCILEPKLDMELNSAGTFTFTVPVENTTLWDNIEVFNGEVVIYEGDDIIWFGRPFQIVRNWKNQKVVTCEGALSYFNDTVQATHTYDTNAHYALYKDNDHSKGFFNRIVELHNDMVRMDGNSSREILVGNITVDNEPDIYREVDYETTAEILQRMCLDTNGGYFMLRKENGNNYIDWVKDMPYATTQKITFGKNLLDVNQDLNGSDICTVLLAFGKDDKTVAGLNQWKTEDDAYILEDGNGVYHNTKDGEYLIHKEGYKKYGRVLKVKTWSDVVANSTEGKRQLFIKAAEWLNDQNTEVLTIECDAADLHYIDADENGKLRIGQKVTVLSPIHGLNGKDLSIFKVSMSLDSGAKHITMGTPPKRELTDIVKSSGGSTRGSSGTTGGGGSDGSSGSGTVSIPVKDVQVKFPGEDKFKTVVKKKIAKLDLSEIASGVTDVRIDDVSIVTNHIANIDSSQFGTEVEANPSGTAVGNLTSILIGEDKYDIPAAIVSDVTLDGESIVDPNDNVAKILSRDIIEEGVEGNFEHVVEKDDDPPTINLGKNTDLFIETDVPDDETIILSSDSDAPINLQEIGGWDKYEQDFVAQPTQYYDESTHTYKYDPESPTRVHHEITCNGAGYTSWWFADVPSAAPLPFSNHEGILTVYGHKIATSSYVDITFEKHDQNIKYRPTKVIGIFNFKIMHAGEEGSYMPVQDEYCCSDIIRIHVSNDGENWTSYAPVSEPQDGNGTFIFDIDGYYSYIRMSCTNNVYNPAGYQSFSVYAVPESVIEDIWYKTANKTWIKMPHVKDVRIDGTSIVNNNIANIDSSQFGTEVEANPQTGTSVGDLTSILIGEDKYDIPSGGGGSSVVPNPSGNPSSRLIKIGIDGVIYEVSAGTGGAESIEFDYTGDIQTFVAPKTATYKLEVWGAQGGSGGADVHGGYGGYSVGEMNLTQGDTLYICVGGKGGGSYTSDTSLVGYNGGGEANYGGGRGNGGGATHIALITGTLNTLSIIPSNVIIVAGGGGGAGSYGAGDEGDGGSGGGYIGGHGLLNGSTTGDINSYTGSGGTQSAGGVTVDYPDTQPDGLFGKGADRYDDSYWGGSGGGGGFYGGGASTNNAGAGGGSGYINTTLLTDACMYGYDVSESAATATKTVSVNLYSSDPEEMKAKIGNGYAKISWAGELDPYVTVGDLYNACVANNVTPASHNLNDIVAEFLRVN